MNIIITGGSGLIGRRLTQSLTQDGHEVVILSRNPAQVSGLPTHARAVRWDAQTADGWEAEAEAANAIVNLAGSNLAGSGFFPARWTADRRNMHTDSRVNAGKAVSAAVARAENKPEVVIQASAIGYYGPRGDEILDESAGPGGDFLAQLCVRWEQSTASVESQGVRRAVIRTGIYLDPADGALQRLLLPYRLFAGGPFGSGKQWYSWIHPEDDIGAIRHILENKTASGSYNLVSPNPLRNKDFGKTIGRVLRRPSILPVPGFAMKLAFGEVATVVLDGQRLAPKRLLEAGFEFQHPELEGALRELLG
jgi:hypothetical protein